MKYTIELSPDEERRLLEAKGRGIEPAAIIKAVLAALPEIPYYSEKPRNPTAELFAEWERDSTLLSSKERQQQDKLDDAVLAYLHAQKGDDAEEAA